MIRLALEKNAVSIILEFLSDLKKQELVLKRSDAAEEMHRAGGFRNAACWLKGNSKLVE